jgi:ABC-type lipoprotein release transport system permease subunit
MSLVYEVWRATAKAGTSRHDSMKVFLSQGVVIYVVAGVVIGLLLAGVGAAAWVGLIFSVGGILVSTFYYNPKIMIERQPGIVDWVEDLVFTGLHFVAATLLLYAVLGRTLG